MGNSGIEGNVIDNKEEKEGIGGYIHPSRVGTIFTLTIEEREEAGRNCSKWRDAGQTWGQINKRLKKDYNLTNNVDYRVINKLIREYEEVTIDLAEFHNINLQRVRSIGEINGIKKQIEEIIKQKYYNIKVSEIDRTGQKTGRKIIKQQLIKPHVLVMFYGILSGCAENIAKINGAMNTGIQATFVNLTQNNAFNSAGNTERESWGDVLPERKEALKKIFNKRNKIPLSNKKIVDISEK
jgi:hypothetical protein